MASSVEERQIAFKHTLDVYHTRTDRQWFEENYGTRHVVVGPDVWASRPKYNDSADAVANGLVIEELEFELTEDPYSAGTLWVAKNNPGVWPLTGPITDFDTLEADRVRNWVSPIVFGASYSFLLKQNDGSLIPTGNWEFLFSEGLLHLDEGFTAADEGWATPLKWSAFRYTGDFGSSAGAAVNSVPFTGVAQVDVPHNLGRLPIVQIFVEASGDLFGEVGFGLEGFSTSSALVEMNKANYRIKHTDQNNFEVIFNNYYNGEILYL